MAPDDRTSPPSASCAESAPLTNPPYDDEQLERYRDKLLPSLREAPPLVQLELLNQLMQDALCEARQSGR